MPTCTSCKIEKSADHFYRAPERRSGLRARCAECQRKSNSAPKAYARKQKRRMQPERRKKEMQRQRERYATDRCVRWTHAEAMLRSAYKIDFEDWARAFEAQDGKCLGCLSALGFDKSTHVDHDHVTKAFRGLLCRHCNLLLGYAKDHPGTLERLCFYLQSRK